MSRLLLFFVANDSKSETRKIPISFKEDTRNAL
jgi:hypothetical protein